MNSAVWPCLKACARSRTRPWPSSTTTSRPCPKSFGRSTRPRPKRRTNMAKFKFTALTLEGATITGVEDAATVTQARHQLVVRDLEPMEVAEKRSVLAFELTKKKVKRKDLMHF